MNNISAVLCPTSLALIPVKNISQLKLAKHLQCLCRAQELCESGGGRPGLPANNIPYGLCGRKATLSLNV